MDKVANSANLLKLLGSAAGGAGKRIGSVVRSNPGAAFDVGAGSALTVADYSGYSPFMGGPEGAAEMAKASVPERALNLAMNIGGINAMRRGISQGYGSGAAGKPLTLGGFTTPVLGALSVGGSAPALRAGSNFLQAAALSTGVINDITRGAKSLNDRGIQILGGTITDDDGNAVHQPGWGATFSKGLFGDEKSPGIIPRLESTVQTAADSATQAGKSLTEASSTIDKRLADISTKMDKRLDELPTKLDNRLTDAFNVARPYLATGLGVGAGGLLGNLFTEPLTDRDSKQDSERKQYRNRLFRALGAVLGGGAGYLGHYLTKKSADSDLAAFAAYPLLAAALGTGIGYAGSGISEYLEPSSTAKEQRKRRNHLMLSGAGSGLGVGLSQVLKAYLAKQASDAPSGAGYGGYQGLSLQQNMPISPRRELTSAEKADVADGQSKWLRGPFASEGDSISRRMASPGKRSILTALAATAAGAGLGAYAGGQSGGSALSGALAGGGLGALGGIPMGILAYLEQQKLNKTLEERMRRLPEGQTTIRDMMSDPVTGYGERMQSMQDQMNPSFSGNQLAQLATLAARVPRR